MDKGLIVTGCCGSLGKKIVGHCITEGISVFGIDVCEPYAFKTPQNTIYCQWDISQRFDDNTADKLQQFMNEHKMIAVIHCAGLVDTSLTATDCFNVNHKGTLHILELMHHFKLNKLVFVSTNQIRFEKTFLWNFFHTPYHKSKLLAEEEIGKYAFEHPGFLYHIVHPGLIYGDGDCFFWKLEQSSKWNFRFCTNTDIIWEGNNIDDLSYSLVFTALHLSDNVTLSDISSPIRSFQHWNTRLIANGRQPLTWQLPKFMWILIGLIWETLLTLHFFSEFLALFFMVFCAYSNEISMMVIGLIFCLFSCCHRTIFQKSFLYITLADSVKMTTSHAHRKNKIKPRKDE